MTLGFTSTHFKLVIFSCLSILNVSAFAGNYNSWITPDKAHSHIPQLTRDGMWSFAYDYTRQLKKGILSGRNVVDPLSVLHNPEYKKLPYPGSHDCKLVTDSCLLTSIGDRMTMDIHKLKLTYHQTPEVSWAVMFQYLSNKADMFDKPSSTIRATAFKLGTGGIGDLQLSLTNQIAKTRRLDIDLTLGIKLPLGSIDKPNGISDMTGNSGFISYDMQMGSGTYDIVTELAINGSYHGFEYGSSVYRATRTGLNNQYYNLGDRLKLKGWSRYTFFFGTQIRAALTQNIWSPIEGRDERMSDNPRYSGGKRLDGSLGLGQRYKHFGVYADYSYPLLQYLNGVQLRTTGVVSAGVEFKYL